MLEKDSLFFLLFFEAFLTLDVTKEVLDRLTGLML
jgi:hypothetical protein